MRIPEKEECLQMLAVMEMPEHIQAHSELVCRVALALADRLIALGAPINRPLVFASALLHDITKSRSFTTGENHSKTGGEYLTDLGFPEVGHIVRQHVILDTYGENVPPNEAQLVNYADKRVLHDQLVSLDDRMNYILHRYAKTEAHRKFLRAVWDQTAALEGRLFARLGITPGQLIDQIGE